MNEDIAICKELDESIKQEVIDVISLIKTTAIMLDYKVRVHDSIYSYIMSVSNEKGMRIGMISFKVLGSKRNKFERVTLKIGNSNSIGLIAHNSKLIKYKSGKYSKPIEKLLEKLGVQ